MMSEHLLELDPEADLLEAFECLDEDDSGVINVADLRRALSGMGDRMSEAEVC